MKAGRLINVISVQRRDPEAVNDFGTVGEAWAALATMRAELVKAHGLEAMGARGADNETATIFRVRAKLEITTADRVIHRSKAFKVVEVVEVGRDFLELHCVTFGGVAP